MKQDDLYRALGDIDDDLLQRSMRRRRPGRMLRFCAAAFAACICFAACAFLWQTLRHDAPDSTGASEQLAAVPSSAPSDSQPAAQQIALSELPQLVFSERDSADAALDIGFPAGWFIRPLDAQTLAGIWGVENGALQWEGFDVSDCALTGEVIYGGDGKVWEVALSGSYGDGSFTVRLAPEQLPAECLGTVPEESCEIYGVSVDAVRRENSCRITFLRGSGEDAVGVRIEADWQTDEQALQELLTRLVSQSLRPDGTLSLHQLDTTDVPEWRSEELTEAQARAEEGFGSYLPQTLPANYVFHSAHRELGENRNSLSIAYEISGYHYLWITVDRCADLSTLVSAEDTARYDKRLYYDKSTNPDAPVAPEEFSMTLDHPIFRAEELSWDLIDARTTPGDDGASYLDFGVLYPDGTVLRLTAHADAADLPSLLQFLLP